MQRIVVTGTPGSGKTTLARQLAHRRKLPYHELAALYWADDWQPSPPEEFAARLREILTTDAWVVDGLYRKDLTWGHADTVVWLDYPLVVVFWRLLRRTLQRARTGETLWQTNNQETWRRAFLSTESPLLGALREHQRRRRNYARKLSQYPHVKVFRLRNPNEAKYFLMNSV